MTPSDREIRNFALIGAGPIGIFLSHLLISKGHKVTLYEAGDRDAETNNLNLDKYIFQTKSKIPNGVHRVGGASNLWKGRVSEFSPEVFNRTDENGNRVWPIDFNFLEEANKYLFGLLDKSGLRDRDYMDKYLDGINHQMPQPFDLNLFRFNDENFFKAILSELENNDNFKLVTKTLVLEIRLPEKPETKHHNVELVSAKADYEGFKTVFYSDVVLTGGCLQSTALVMKSNDILNKLSAPSIVGKYLMEHFDGYVGTLRISAKDKPFLKKLILDDSRRIPGKEFGVGLTIAKDKESHSEQIAFHLELVDWRKTYLFDPNLNIFNGLPSGLYEMFFFLERVLKKIPSELRKIWLRASSTEIYSVWLKGEEIPFESSELQISRDSDPRKIKLIYNHRVSRETKNLMRDRLREISVFLRNNQFGKFRIHLYFRLNRLFYTGPNFHPMGSLRMGADPKNSIVGANFSFHGSPHVFAVNSGVFPNGSNHNPTAMVLALSVIFASSF